MNNFRIRISSLGAIGVGSLMAAAALVTSNSAIERALLGRSDGSLSWGPTLFRALLVGHALALIFVGFAWLRARSARATARKESVDCSAQTRKSEWLILAGLSGLALILRLWHLNSDLWYDELISLLNFVRPPLGEIVTSFSSQNQHMFYSILAHGSIGIFGESAAAVRLPSVLFGVASLWALFLLGRSLIGVRESLLACALTTVSYHHIWFSQNARGYMGLLFLATLATWLLLEALTRNSWGYWISYAVAIALGMWVHMTMAFVVAAHGLLWLTWLGLGRMFANSRPHQSFRFSWKPLVAWLLCVTITLQLHALALPEFLSSALHMESLPSEWSSPWWIILESLRSLKVGFSGVVVLLFGIVMLGVGYLSILKRNAFAGVALVLPAVLGGVTMLLLGHYIWPRFFFFSMGFAMLIAIHGAVTLPSLVGAFAFRPSRQHLWQTAGVVLASILIAASIFTLPKVYALPKQDFTGARDWVERSREPGDTVVAVGLAGIAYGRYFAPTWSVAQSQAELDAVMSNRSNVWLVYILPIQLKAYRADIWNTIQNEFQIVEVFPGTLGGGGVYVCRQRSAIRTQPSGSNLSLAR
jgi:mannosyltransferase